MSSAGIETHTQRESRVRQPVGAFTKRVSAFASSDRLAWILVVLLAVVPLPLGSNRPWSWSLASMLLGLLALTLSVAATHDRKRLSEAARQSPMTWRLWCALAGFLLTAFWAFLQSLPLGIDALVHPTWHLLATIGEPRPGLIGLDAADTRDAAMRFLAYGAAFWVAWWTARDRAIARRLLSAVVVIATCYAAYGLVNHFAGIRWILPGVERISLWRLQSTFVNPNNFATFVNIGLIAALACMLEPLLGHAPRDGARPGFAKVLESVLDRRGGSLALATLLLASASLLTGSRGGLVSLAIALVFMALLVMRQSGAGLAMRIGVPVVMAMAFVGLVSLSGQHSLGRMTLAMGLGDLRMGIFELTGSMIADRPLLGHGYGNFETAFMAYRDERFLGVVDKAHNTYLEHIAELGIPMALVLYTAFSMVVLELVSGSRQRKRDRIYPFAALACTVLVASHALVDFSLQIPAVAITYSVVLGVGVAQSRSSRGTTTDQRNQRVQPSS